MGRVFLGFLLLVLFVSSTPVTAVEPQQWMPTKHDHTSMWWANGFPSHSSDFPWHRCVQTGRYGFVLDTESMQMPHFGSVEAATLSQLPPAELGLRITADGKPYDCVAGGQWTRKTGPRLIESGRFLQRGDVTDLVFRSSDGDTLNADARMETAAWPDRLGLILAARPGKQSIQSGDESFGRIGGGYGLDGQNDFEVAHDPALDTATFTLALWAFVPHDYRASEKTPPWLVCKNRNEAREGNFGILISNGYPEARINIGGSAENSFTARSPQPIKTGQWSHFAFNYDGSDLCLYVNGGLAAKRPINRPRVAGSHSLVFGRREDGFGDGYRFRGVIDEIAYFAKALSPSEIRQAFNHPETVDKTLNPIRYWGFRSDGLASLETPREQWGECELTIELTSGQRVVKNVIEVPRENGNIGHSWHEVGLAIDPVSMTDVSPTLGLSVTASEPSGGNQRPVTYDHAIGWHRINLDGVEPVILSRGVDPGGDPRNDAMERVRLSISNTTDRPQVARLMFEKTRGGVRQRIGTPITGISAILRDTAGNPTGIPVQLSKNWHVDGTDDKYATQWFHGISQVRLPSQTNVELELSIVYGHWGGVPAASTSQLSLIGWGSNQLWNQAAIGSWGESICFEPDQAQADCSVTDVRPLMVQSKPNSEHWKWTANVGGGDFFRMFDRDGKRVPHTAMKTAFDRYGPCLTEVTNRGLLTRGIQHAETISLSRTDDILRVTYHLTMQVDEPTEFSRLAFFQIGADTYNFTRERKMAVGNASGLIQEWDTTWGGNQYRTAPIEGTGDSPWASLHDAIPRENQRNPESWATRGIVIRSWKARLGGADASPWMAERGVRRRTEESSTLDLVPPPGLTRLEPGDFVEATIEHLIVPRDAGDYYGPNEALRSALANHANTWRMIQREASGNLREVDVEVGELRKSYPDIRIRTVNDEARFKLTGGLGYVPITFTGLTSPHGYKLMINDQPFNQNVHGNDFWQTDYEPEAKRWSQTFNVPGNLDGTTMIHFQPIENLPSKAIQQ